MKKGRRQEAARARLLWALGFSIACHAVVLAVLADWRPSNGDSMRGTVVVVALVGGGDAGGGVTGEDTAGGDGDATADASTTAPADQPEVPDDASADTAPAEKPERQRPRRRLDRSEPRVSQPASAAKPASEDGAAIAGGQAQASVAGGGFDGPAAGGSGAGDGASGSGDGTGRSGESGGGSGDLRASCRSCPTPDYPARARRQGWQGTVDVQVRVDRDGTVEQAEIGRSSGFALLDDAAVTVARRSRFRVSSEGGLRGRLRYRFILEETAGGPF